MRNTSIHQDQLDLEIALLRLQIRVMSSEQADTERSANLAIIELCGDCLKNVISSLKK